MSVTLTDAVVNALRIKLTRVLSALQDYQRIRAQVVELLDDPSLGPLVRSVSTQSSQELRAPIDLQDSASRVVNTWPDIDTKVMRSVPRETPGGLPVELDLTDDPLDGD